MAFPSSTEERIGHLLEWPSYTCRTYRSGLVGEHSLTKNKYHKWMKERMGARDKVHYLWPTQRHLALSSWCWQHFFVLRLIWDSGGTDTWQNFLGLTPVSPMTAPLFGLTTFMPCYHIFSIFLWIYKTTLRLFSLTQNNLLWRFLWRALLLVSKKAYPPSDVLCLHSTVPGGAEAPES